MVRSSILRDALKIVTQASQQGKRQVIVRPVNEVVIQFFKMMQKNNYIQDFTVVDDRRGRINKCAVISPRFDVSVNELEQWTNRLLPSRLFGYVILTTSDGIMDHREASRRNIGGKIIGFFY